LVCPAEFKLTGDQLEHYFAGSSRKYVDFGVENRLKLLGLQGFVQVFDRWPARKD
jgi:hypothetical protein